MPHVIRGMGIKLNYIEVKGKKYVCSKCKHEFSVEEVFQPTIKSSF